MNDYINETVRIPIHIYINIRGSVLSYYVYFKLIKNCFKLLINVCMDVLSFISFGISFRNLAPMWDKFVSPVVLSVF